MWLQLIKPSQFFGYQLTLFENYRKRTEPVLVMTYELTWEVPFRFGTFLSVPERLVKTLLPISAFDQIRDLHHAYLITYEQVRSDNWRLMLAKYWVWMMDLWKMQCIVNVSADTRGGDFVQYFYFCFYYAVSSFSEGETKQPIHLPRNRRHTLGW